MKKNPPKTNTIDFLLTCWSDDFEPYNIKSNKGGSVWVMTVSIYLKHANKYSSNNTYVISMGKKNDDHGPIEKNY